MLTLADAQSSTLKNIAGVVPTSQDFLDYLNESTRILMRRGDWVGTVRPIQIAVMRGLITFPRYVGSVRKMAGIGGSVTVTSQWYEFLEPSHHREYHWETPNMLIGPVRVPVYANIMGSGRTLRAYCENANDAGQSVTITCLDGNGLKQTLNLVLANPYVESPYLVAKIIKVIKPVTYGRVGLYGYNTCTQTLEDVAQYDAGETEPEFMQYELKRHGISNYCELTAVAALVKLKFVPVVTSTDLVLIDNLDALKLMMQSCRFADAGDRDSARKYETDAIRELNLQLGDENPDYQTPVSVEPFNGIGIGRQRSF